MWYDMICDKKVPSTQGPNSTLVTQREGVPPCTYRVQWRSPLACGVTACAPPVPTSDQLDYHSMEIGALISFNLATGMGTQGCGPAPAGEAAAESFNARLPAIPNTDQWCQAIASFGGRWGTLVAKHECGFCLWPTKASSGGFTYNYSVAPGRDVVRAFAESCAAVGVKIGLYYSVNRNSYLGIWDSTTPRAGSPISTQVPQQHRQLH